MTASQDPYRFFRVEAAELSEELSRGVLALEGGAPADLFPKLLRAAQTLKGAARLVEHRRLAEQSHEFEELVAKLRDRGAPPAHDDVEALLVVTDAISTLVRDLSPSPTVAEHPDVMRHEELPHVPMDTAELQGLSEAVSETGVHLSAVRAAAAALERTRQLSALLLQRIAVSTEAGEAERRSSLLAARSIATELAEVTEKAERSVSGSLDRTERELAQVQRAADRLRLVPVSALLASLERTARDVGSELGKRVTLRLSGGDIRLDAQMLAQMRGALVQAVRNAVAHGIEPSAERLAKGKKKEGTVDVRVVRRGGRVSFQCRDDGRGIDLRAVGLAAERAVTEASGRGMGLEVIRDTAARLGGECSLRSEPGGGATLEVSVPIVLSAIEALLVEVSGSVAAIPLDAVSGALRLAREAVVRTSEGDSVVVDGRVLPFRQLAGTLSPGEVSGDGRAVVSAVIVRGANRTAALGVDRLVGTASVVVRGLPALALTDPMVLGASLDADGMPQIVLEPNALVRDALKEPGAKASR